MIVTSSSFVLTASTSPALDDPIIGYRNIITPQNISANDEDANFPVTNLANPSTALRWQAGVDYYYAADIRVTIAPNSNETIDYVGIARHNLGSAGIPVSIEGRVGVGSFSTLVGPQQLGDDSPAIFRWAGGNYSEIAIVMETGEDPPTIGVAYCSQLLYLQRRIYVGHTPIKYGRQVKEATGVSEAGHFLGSINLQEGRQSSVSMKNLTPSWYRANLDPFIESAISGRNPFFFGWRPDTYPLEAGYCWLKGNPMPVNTLPNGMMGIDLQMEGVA